MSIAADALLHIYLPSMRHIRNKTLTDTSPLHTQAINQARINNRKTNTLYSWYILWNHEPGDGIKHKAILIIFIKYVLHFCDTQTLLFHEFNGDDEQPLFQSGSESHIGAGVAKQLCNGLPRNVPGFRFPMGTV